jgi:hypothetical protein
MNSGTLAESAPGDTIEQHPLGKFIVLHLLPRLSRLKGWAPLWHILLFSLYHFFSPWERDQDICHRFHDLHRVVEKEHVHWDGCALCRKSGRLIRHTGNVSFPFVTHVEIAKVERLFSARMVKIVGFRTLFFMSVFLT